jgi:ribonuclease HII
MTNQLEIVDWTKFKPGPVFGVDEVGRGCLAGPVVAGAACLDLNLRDISLLQGLTDSKLLSDKKREVFAEIVLTRFQVGLGFASPKEIDELNILQASLLAMKRAVEALEEKMGQKAGQVLIDGQFKIPDLKRSQTCLIKGDLRCLPISAAAVVAKVHRDSMMSKFGERYPRYGFEKHKGYASALHREAIKSCGVTDIHRKSFRGVKEYL